MAGAFARNAQVTTGRPPFAAMRKNAAAAGAMLGQKMGEFVAQSALDFFDTEFLQHGIEHDASAAWLGATDRRAHARVPLDAQARGQSWRADFAQEGDGKTAEI
jgi:hypothetical protein